MFYNIKVPKSDGFKEVSKYNEGIVANLEYLFDHAINSGVYNFATQGGAVGSYVLGSIKDNMIIIRAWYQVITSLTSGGSATVALGITEDDATGILGATAYDNAAFSGGYHDATPNYAALNFTTQTTANRDIVLTIGTAALTAGKIKVWWQAITGE